MDINCAGRRRRSRRQESTFLPTATSPLSSPSEAIEAIRIATHNGTAPTGIAACIDSDGYPITMMIVDDCPADGVPKILDVVLDAAGPRFPVASMILAISRPGTDPAPTAQERLWWHQLVVRAEASGVDLWAWYALADGEVEVIGSRG